MATSDLFRTEAVDHQRQRFHGTVVLARPWSYAALTGLLTALVGALVVFAGLAGFTRKEVVGGIVVPDSGLIRVVAPLGGRVSEVRVVAGATVRAGDVMFVVQRDRATASGVDQRSISANLASRQQRLERELDQQVSLVALRRAEAEGQVRGLQASLAQITRERAAQAQRVQVLHDIARRHVELAREGMVSQTLAQAKAAEALEQEVELATIDRARADTERELATVRAQLAQLPLQADREQSALKREMDAMREQIDENELTRELSVRAARDGVVAAVLAEPGQPVDSAAELATLVPQGAQLEAELFLPSRAVGHLRPGQPVQLRFEAYPYEKYGLFSGRVRSVSLSPVAPTERAAGLAPPAAGHAGLSSAAYRARVTLDLATLQARTGSAQPLRPGMLLSASVALEHRSLAEWALAPLLGLRQTL